MVSPECWDNSAKDHRLHVPCDGKLDIGQSAFRLYASKCPNTINDKRISGDWLLETLLPAPYAHSFSQHFHKKISSNMAYKSCWWRTNKLFQYWFIDTDSVKTHFWRTIREPSAIRRKSARPCAITERLLFSMTFGSTVNAGGRLASPYGKTSIFAHNVQSTSTGAWIAALTSARLKYTGESGGGGFGTLERFCSTQ